MSLGGGDNWIVRRSEILGSKIVTGITRGSYSILRFRSLDCYCSSMFSIVKIWFVITSVWCHALLVWLILLVY